MIFFRRKKYIITLFIPKYFCTIFFFFAGKAAIEIDDERTTTLIQKVNELLEAFIGIHDLDLGKKTISHSIKILEKGADSVKK